MCLRPLSQSKGRMCSEMAVQPQAENHNGDFTPTDVRVTGCSFELPKPEEE